MEASELERAKEIDRQRVEHAVAELKQTIDAYMPFQSGIVSERAILYTMDKVPLRLKVEVADRALQYMRERWPHMFDEKGELKK